MRKLFIGILFLSFCLHLNAQNKEQDKYITIGLDVNPWLSEPATLENSHRPGIGLRFDFHGRKNKAHSFNTGFSVLTVGDHDNFLDITDSENIEVTEVNRFYRIGTYKVKYFSLPLFYKFQKKWFYFSTGLEPYFRLNQEEIHSESIRIDLLGVDFEDFSKEKVRNLNAAFSISVALQIPLGDAWHFYIEPNYQRLLSSVYKDDIDNINRNFLFLRLGLKSKLFLPKTGAK